jgi:aspartyl-tRNA(Asn)/glutamyl-tRNA(Gln) amidotransferase subunit C
MINRIDRKEIEQIAAIAKLDVSRENESFFEDINNLLKIINKFAQTELNAGDYKIDMELVNTFREDEVKPSIPRELVLANAPAVEAGCISVPKTVGKDE